MNNYIILNNNIIMPVVGFGLAGKPNIESIKYAIKLGVRLFDTAQAENWYNEKDLGDAIKSFPEINRNKFFITTKLHPKNHGYNNTITSFNKSLSNLNTTYIDLFLLHYPECWKELCGNYNTNETFHDSWRALEYLLKQGKIRAIGISNFNEYQLETLIQQANIIPAVMQNWMDPLHQDLQLRKLCKQYNIFYQSYSTLGTQWQSLINPVLNNSTISKIATKHNLTNVKTILYWALQQNPPVGIIPRSNNLEHIKENTQIQQNNILTQEDINTINNLNIQSNNL